MGEGAGGETLASPVKRRLHQHISVGELQKGVAENGVGAGAVETGGIIVVLLDISVITTQAFRR